MNRFKKEVLTINKLELDIEIVIKEYSNYVFKIINNIVGNSLPYHDKEEIASSVFYLLWKNQDKINKDIKSYLATITRNYTYNMLNKNKKIVSLEDNTISYEDNVIDKLFIEEIVSNLLDDEKIIFDLYYVKGYKIGEISKMLGKSLTSIKVSLYRIRMKLRRYI